MLKNWIEEIFDTLIDLLGIKQTQLIPIPIKVPENNKQIKK